jgi:hypothetical protein
MVHWEILVGEAVVFVAQQAVDLLRGLQKAAPVGGGGRLRHRLTPGSRVHLKIVDQPEWVRLTNSP